MEQEKNEGNPHDQARKDDREDRMRKTRKLLFEEEISEIRNQFEKSLKFDRELMVQNLAEHDLEFKQSLRETNDLLSSLSDRIEIIEAEVKHLRQNKIDVQKLAIVLSDLSLQLMNISNTTDVD